MSREAVETIIGKAVLDDEFREALFANPERALEGYDLTEEEVAALKGIDAETMDALAGTLDERISKADFMGMISAASGESLGTSLGKDQAALSPGGAAGVNLAM
jgi:hypothetical protein